jgi:predicted GIY-YIG superfamily endonuclease
MEQKRIVYILKTLQQPARYYIGVTANLRQRLEHHNQGRSPHTALHRPWVVDVAIKFADERRATALEKYLKTGSGYAFAIRHLR